MATLYRFDPPLDTKIPLETQPILSLYTRMFRLVGSTVIQKVDGTWAQFDYAWDGTLDPANKYFFGGQGFGEMDSVGVSASFPGCNRLYLGGHQYVINAALKSELESAATTQHPEGYAAYISQVVGYNRGAYNQGTYNTDLVVQVDNCFTGDEIMLSGRHPWLENPTVQFCTKDGYVQTGWGAKTWGSGTWGGN